MNHETEIIAALQKENEALKKQLETAKKKRQKSLKRKYWFLKKAGVVFVGIGLKNSISRAIDEFNESKTLFKDTIADLSANIILRITRIGIVAALITLLPTILLFQQNRIVKNQNKLFKVQNERIVQQTYLEESSRRSSQMFIMGEVLSDLNAELEDPYNSAARLSPTLTGRIISLSRAMKPYRYLEGDVLIKKPISPERGQLLISLQKSKINSGDLRNKILFDSDFSYSELYDAVLAEANLSNANLSYADLRNANLKKADLRNVDLTHADLSNAVLSSANLSNAILTKADLRNTDLSSADLRNLTLDSAKVDRDDWLIYIKDSLKLRGAKGLYDTYKVGTFTDESGKESPMLLLKENTD